MVVDIRTHRCPFIHIYSYADAHAKSSTCCFSSNSWPWPEVTLTWSVKKKNTRKKWIEHDRNGVTVLLIWCCNPFVMNLTFSSCVGRVVCSFAFANSIFSWEKHTGNLPADALQCIPIFLGFEPASSKALCAIKQTMVSMHQEQINTDKHSYQPTKLIFISHPKKVYPFMSKIMGQHGNQTLPLHRTKIRWLCHFPKCVAPFHSWLRHLCQESRKPEIEMFDVWWCLFLMLLPLATMQNLWNVSKLGVAPSHHLFLYFWVGFAALANVAPIPAVFWWKYLPHLPLFLLKSGLKDLKPLNWPPLAPQCSA